MEEHSLIRQHYENLYNEYYTEQYRTYLKGEKYRKSLFEGGKYLISYSLGKEKLLEGIPAAVTNGYNYYLKHICGRGLGGIGVYKLPCDGHDTYAIRVSTDGSDGWLEVYDRHGQEVGTARTYIDLIGWGNREEIRGYVHNFEFPDSLNDKSKRTLWQFGSIWLDKGTPNRYIVVAEEVPKSKQDDFVQIICDATGVTAQSVRIILDLLPRWIATNMSREEADNIWKRLTNTGVKASIKEHQDSSGFVVVKTNVSGNAGVNNNN